MPSCIYAVHSHCLLPCGSTKTQGARISIPPIMSIEGELVLRQRGWVDWRQCSSVMIVSGELLAKVSLFKTDQLYASCPILACLKCWLVVLV